VEKHRHLEHQEVEFKVHRIATYGRKDLARIMDYYTRELLYGEQEPIEKEEIEKFELGRRAFGHLPHKKVYLIRKMDVYKTGPGQDDISVKVFMESERSSD
jgi:hypothetical protein